MKNIYTIYKIKSLYKAEVLSNVQLNFIFSGLRHIFINRTQFRQNILMLFDILSLNLKLLVSVWE